ncbi:GntR family transcriptional regulator [Rhizobium sp. VS19-DR104.2]|uniref:GntR family transcriptional regulator n=1 Tax=unclassified Rhizobium TaxID=2613769 RepID=UPI001C5B1420|nr:MULTISPECIES: GntR family transcriptional regulator [unclassified Rhizobium]MBZ5763458.1 GntR family transcriptional regulator [Rhizobium sp. VS19-DR96]MBZ5769397.1 GntR family transcriptional regulator [Rhizobium sp. VS19-DR129.2]MBZ5777227.1 GntR family transcriptional regulator [Rhizobium sp. VS19-DRK62.2]MBZ5788029.1 GntR family transcriptional regulator [Rhizobium sp. VS19-DR121]MBZ5805520.1 GntR family transcriptional regulator [Rhizobium sp. VS19-DR181]
MTARIAALQPDTLRRQSEKAVRDNITSGRYVPGSRLIERELCEDLGVSRTSLREALRKLEAEKLVEIVPHKGPVVAIISLEEARELYALRGVLEGFAAREFAQNGSDASIEEFAKGAEFLRRESQSGDTTRVIDAKSLHYNIMLAHCGNHLLKEVLQSLFSRINILRATSLMHPNRISQSLTEIDDLAAALRRRDAPEAEKLASLHVRNACVVAMQLLEEQRRLILR